MRRTSRPESTYSERLLTLAPEDFRVYYDLAYEFDGVSLDTNLIDPEEIELATQAAQKYELPWPPSKRDAERLARMYRSGADVFRVAKAVKQSDVSWDRAVTLVDMIVARMSDITDLKFLIGALRTAVEYEDTNGIIQLLKDIHYKLHNQEYKDIVAGVLSEFTGTPAVDVRQQAVLQNVNRMYYRGQQDALQGFAPSDEGDAAYMNGYLGY